MTERQRKEESARHALTGDITEAVTLSTELKMAKSFQTRWFYHFATSSASYLGLSELRIMEVETTEEPTCCVMLVIT